MKITNSIFLYILILLIIGCSTKKQSDDSDHVQESESHPKMDTLAACSDENYAMLDSIEEGHIEPLVRFLENGGDPEFECANFREYYGGVRRLAKNYGKNMHGFRHLGAAFHVMEDYFAHTNFVEIALIKRGHTKVYPWVELPQSVIDETDGPTKACQIPLVTGLFGSDDMIASLAPKIADEFFPTKIEEYKALKPGDRTFFDVLFIIIMNDYIDKDKNLPQKDKSKVPSTNYTYQELKDLYEKYLGLRDDWLKLVNNTWVGPIFRSYDWLMHQLSQGLKYYPNLLLNALLSSTSQGIKNKQAKQTGYGSDPTHTQLAKDPVTHILNPIAGKLAFIVVKEIGRQMKEVWSGNMNIETLIDNVEIELFQHPCTLEWINEYIDDWASSHSNAVRNAESKTPGNHTHSIKVPKIKLSKDEIDDLENSLNNYPIIT